MVIGLGERKHKANAVPRKTCTWLFGFQGPIGCPLVWQLGSTRQTLVRFRGLMQRCPVMRCSLQQLRPRRNFFKLQVQLYMLGNLVGVPVGDDDAVTARLSHKAIRKDLWVPFTATRGNLHTRKTRSTAGVGTGLHFATLRPTKSDSLWRKRVYAVATRWRVMQRCWLAFGNPLENASGLRGVGSQQMKAARKVVVEKGHEGKSKRGKCHRHAPTLKSQLVATGLDEERSRSERGRRAGWSKQLTSDLDDEAC